MGILVYLGPHRLGSCKSLHEEQICLRVPNAPHFRASKSEGSPIIHQWKCLTGNSLASSQPTLGTPVYFQAPKELPGNNDVNLTMPKK